MSAKRSPFKQGRGGELSELMSTVALVAVLIATWTLVILEWGLLPGLLLGWIIAPIAGLGAALLVLIWTVPIRGADVLSLRSQLADSSRQHLRGPAAPVTITAIVPAFNARNFLQASLPALMALHRRGELKEVIIVDDGGTDGSAELAQDLGARVIASGGRLGPGGARNVAAAVAEGEVLWFVDADVIVHEDSAGVLQDAFQEAGVVAVFGSYDDRPPARNFASQYKNLVHHHYHQHARTEAETFWSGCGAVRKADFIAAGGFDAKAYPNPSIEDIDLGYRLRGLGGAIRLDRRLLSTHLKVWSVRNMVHTDLFRRAVPWARLMLNREEVLDDLNVGTFERLRACCAAASVLFLCGAAIGFLPWWALAPLGLTLLTGNWHLFRLFAKRRGLAFALGGLAFHQVYYLYSGSAFVGCWLESQLFRRRGWRAGPSLGPSI